MSFAELSCERSPAARWAILQLHTQLKPQADHHHLNPVLLSTGWESKDQPYLWQLHYSLGCEHSPNQTLLSNRKELLADFMGDCILKLRVHSLRYKDKTHRAVSVELVLLPLQVGRAEHLLTSPENPPATCLHSGSCARSKPNHSAVQAFPVAHAFLLAEKHKEQRMEIQFFIFQANYSASPSNITLLFTKADG